MKPAQQTGRASCLLSHSYSSVSFLYALLIALSVVMVASYGACAGEQINNDLVAPAPSASHFRSNEISVGVFGNYLDTYGENHQGIGDHAVWKPVTSTLSIWACQLMVMRLMRFPETILAVR